jgi:hypothetical protein
MKGKILQYRNKVEGVCFNSRIADLGEINQWRISWVETAFLNQVGAERLLRVLPALGVDDVSQSDDGAIRWRWNERYFIAFWTEEPTLFLSISDGESRRDDLFDLIGPLTSDFILESMHQIERAFIVLLKLKLHLEEKKGVSFTMIPGHVVADQCVIRVHLDGTLYYKEPGRVYDTATTRIHGYIEEFEAPPAEPDPVPLSALTTSLNLA